MLNHDQKGNREISDFKSCGDRGIHGEEQDWGRKCANDEIRGEPVALGDSDSSDRRMKERERGDEED